MSYRFADVVVQSDVPLSELPESPSGPVECWVRFGRLDAAPPSEDRWDHHWRSPEGEIALSCSRDGGSYRLGVPQLATFFIEDGGRSVACSPCGVLPATTLEHLLIDQVLPRVLTILGRLVLHAGCVMTPHGAVAFLGASGQGKSTLCAEFARAGCPILGDDGIVVRPAAAGYEAIATYPGLRLFPEPLDALFERRAGSTPVAHYTAKRRLDGHAARIDLAAGPERLRALYLLDADNDVAIRSVPEREAFMALVRASFQLHLDDPERSRELFGRIGDVLDAVPVRRLSYPRDLSRLAGVRQAVLADAASLAPASSFAESAWS